MNDIALAVRLGARFTIDRVLIVANRAVDGGGFWPLRLQHRELMHEAHVSIDLIKAARTEVPPLFLVDTEELFDF